MNKLIALFLLTLISAFALSQSITVTDSAHFTNYSGLPFCPDRPYSYGQTIYYESEIQGSGYITGLSFYYLGNNLSHSDSVAFYIGPTDSDYMKYLLKSAPLTKVFDFVITYSSLPGYVTIQLKTPYFYSGVGNLIIAANELRASFDFTNILFAGFYNPPPPGKGGKSYNVYSIGSINPYKLDFSSTLCVRYCLRSRFNSKHHSLWTYTFSLSIP